MKKQVYIILVIMIFPFFMKGQSYDENFTKSTAYFQPYNWSEVQANNIPADNKAESITYYDGLGRIIQSVEQRVGGDRENLTIPNSYDGLGRQTKKYLALPTTSNDNGEYYEGASGTSIYSDLNNYYRGKFSDDFFQGSGYIPDYDNPFSDRLLESSPLNRVIKESAPGFDWHLNYSNHSIKLEYLLNTSIDAVHNFRVNYDLGDYTDPELSYVGIYSVNELYKEVVKDENWKVSDGNNKTIHEFKDKNGVLVLKRTYNNDEILDTYYVYDDEGNIIYVISPEGSEKIVVNGGLSGSYQNILNDLCYQYKYDLKGRVFEKQLPGRGVESIIYDKLDRPILTQNALQIENNEWYFTKYDALSRVLYTGILSGYNKTSIQTGLSLGLPLNEFRVSNGTNVNGTVLYYTNNAFPNASNLQVHTINYYDDYVDIGTLGVLPNVNSFGTAITSRTKALLTVAKIRVLKDIDPPNSSQYWITTQTGYDKKGRPIYVDTENTYLLSNDRAEILLDFNGKPMESLTVHSITGVSPNTVITKDFFTYDHTGRSISHQQIVDNEPVQLIYKNYYDDLGQLYKKDVGGETFIDGFTGIENADVSFDGVISKTIASNNWSSGAKTRGEVINDGGIVFTVPRNDKFVRVGLKKVNAGTLGPTGWQYFDYAISCKENGTVQLVVNGIEGGVVSTYEAGNTFSVERVGSNIIFKKGNSQLGTIVTDATNGQAFVGKASLYSGSGEIENFSLFGSIIDNVLQSIDYKYNVRGWLTDINDVDTHPENSKLFNFKINYNEDIQGSSSSAGVEPLFNGNISQTTWKTANIDNQKRTYGYTYDDLNRIENAFSRRGVNLNILDQYGVSGIVYDKNGNIEQLNRHGMNSEGTENGIWDGLVYSYDGNKLIEVTDNSPSPNLKNEGFYDGNTLSDDFTYDINGNMISDANKGITNITYNYLDLPVKITFSGAQNGIISYVYDALGVKLEKRVTKDGAINVTKYANKYVYMNDELQFFSHPEGYIEPVTGTTESVRGSLGGTTTQSGYSYVFQYTDHLGSVRLSYSDSDLNGSIATNEIVEESNYYPFGLKQKGYNNFVQGGNSLAQKWKYAGKELNEELELNMYDFGARNFDSSLGRWFGIDNLAETYANCSPYHYSNNNPILFYDVDGNGFAEAAKFLNYSRYNDEDESNHTTIVVMDNHKWTSTGDGEYRNNSTGEVTKDHERAISETRTASNVKKASDLLADMTTLLFKQALFTAERVVIREKNLVRKTTDKNEGWQTEELKENSVIKRVHVSLNPSYAVPKPDVPDKPSVDFSMPENKNFQLQLEDCGVKLVVYYTGGGDQFSSAKYGLSGHAGVLNSKYVNARHIQFFHDEFGEFRTGILAFYTKEDHDAWFDLVYSQNYNYFYRKLRQAYDKDPVNPDVSEFKN